MGREGPGCNFQSIPESAAKIQNSPPSVSRGARDSHGPPAGFLSAVPPGPTRALSTVSLHRDLGSRTPNHLLRQQRPCGQDKPALQLSAEKGLNQHLGDLEIKESFKISTFQPHILTPRPHRSVTNSHGLALDKFTRATAPEPAGPLLTGRAPPAPVRGESPIQEPPPVSPGRRQRCSSRPGAVGS